MGMTSKGLGRVRWIRVLVVVLALTASRNNFPLLKSVWTPLSKPSPTLSGGTQKESKKSEEVRPSRRSLESRRATWLQPASSEVPHKLAFARPEAAPVAAGGAVRHDHEEAFGPGPSPEHLRRFLRTSHVSTLTPPA